MADRGKVGRTFDGVAAVYDRMNRVLSLGCDLAWRRDAARKISSPPKRILDVACGTGDFAFALSRRFPNAEIVALDFTPAMLEIARSKSRSPKISFAEGDAQKLDGLAESSFDLVSCAFGFRNFPDKRAALAAARRVVREGGELLALEFFRPRCRALGGFVSLWVKLVAGLFTPRHSEAYGHLTSSMRSTMSEEEFAALAGECGFALAERSSTFVESIFKAKLGLPVQAYVTSVKMREARRLLSDPGLRISEIAYLCGFSSPQYFCRTFTATYGISPKRYRTDGRSSEESFFFSG